MRSWGILRQEVGEWSEKNFGGQISQYNGDHLSFRAPLLGVFEELGELEEARKLFDQNEARDACADAAIYMMDFLWRRGIEVDPEFLHPHLGSLMIVASKLARAVLKCDQGIRGYSGEHARGTIVRSSHMLLARLDYLCRNDLRTTLLATTNDTWERIVSKRDWVNNPQGELTPCHRTTE